MENQYEAELMSRAEVIGRMEAAGGLGSGCSSEWLTKLRKLTEGENEKHCEQKTHKNPKEQK